LVSQKTLKNTTCRGDADSITGFSSEHQETLTQPYDFSTVISNSYNKATFPSENTAEIPITVFKRSRLFS